MTNSRVEMSAFGQHLEALDEDISIDGLLAGRGGHTVAGRRSAAIRRGEP